MARVAAGGPNQGEMERFKRILVATDFSTNAGIAFERALRIASAHGARVNVVHAVDSLSVETLPLPLQEEITESLEVIEQIAERADVPVSSRYEVGRPWDVVARAERETGADLVVIGARGHTSFHRLFLGRTADRVLRVAQAPVLTVHAEDADGAEIRTALVASDFSEESALATSAALRFLRGMGDEGRLVLLHAWLPLVEYEYVRSGGTLLDRLDESDEQAEAILEGLAAPLRGHGIEVDTVVRQGYPASVIGHEAIERHADLIAVGTRGRSGLARFMMGSVAERVLHSAPCPVLSVRRPDPADPIPLSSEEAAVQRGLQ